MNSKINFGATSLVVGVLIALVSTGAVRTHWGEGAQTQVSAIDGGIPTFIVDEQRVRALIETLMGEDVDIEDIKPFLYGGALVNFHKGGVKDSVVVLPGEEHLVAGTWYSVAGPLLETIPPGQENKYSTAPSSYPEELPHYSGTAQPNATMAQRLAGYQDDLLPIAGREQKPHWPFNYGEGIASLRSLSELWAELESLPSIEIGTGSKNIYIMFDPLCGYCQKQYQIIARALDSGQLNHFTFHWIPVVRFLDESSEAIAFNLGAQLSDAALTDGEVGIELLSDILRSSANIPSLLEGYALTKAGRGNIVHNTRLFYRVIQGLPEGTPGRGTPISILKDEAGKPMIVGGVVSHEELLSLY